MDLQSLLSKLDSSEQAKLQELISLVKPGTEGLVGIESNKLRIPTVKIVQAQSLSKADCPEGSRMGQLYIPGTNLGNQIELVPVFAYNSRTMFVAGDNSGVIECSSVDGVNGSKFGKCTDCPNLPWRNDQRTACMDNINVFALTSDLTRFVRIIFAKTSESSGKFLVRQAARTRKIWDTQFILSSEAKSKTGKNWHQFKVSVSSSLPSPTAQVAAEIFNSLVKEDYNGLKANTTKLVGIEEPSSQQQPKALPFDTDDGDGSAPDFNM
jgi:hypothetical protein